MNQRVGRRFGEGQGAFGGLGVAAHATGFAARRQLIIQGGRWEGRPVVPPSWIEASFRSAVAIDGPVRYGLHWYLGEAPVATKSGRRLKPWVGAFGNGGQRLFVMPGLELAVVITAGNYNQPDQSQMPLRLWRDIVLPGLIVN